MKNTREKERKREGGGAKFVATILRLLVLHGKLRDVRAPRSSLRAQR